MKRTELKNIITNIVQEEKEYRRLFDLITENKSVSMDDIDKVYYEPGGENDESSEDDKSPEYSSRKTPSKVPVKSVIEKIAKDVWDSVNIEEAKKLFLNFIQSTHIKEGDKKKIESSVSAIKDLFKLKLYVANALLKYEGLGVGTLKERKLTSGEIKEKEKIVKGMKKGGFKGDKSSLYSIATSKAKKS